MWMGCACLRRCATARRLRPSPRTASSRASLWASPWTRSMEEEEEDDATTTTTWCTWRRSARVHSDYYAWAMHRFLSGESPEAPDIRKIVPELRSKVLADVAIIFSGLHPTNFPVERTRSITIARALGARILTQLVLDLDDPARPTPPHRRGKGRVSHPQPARCPAEPEA